MSMVFFFKQYLSSFRHIPMFESLQFFNTRMYSPEMAAGWFYWLKLNKLVSFIRKLLDNVVHWEVTPRRVANGALFLIELRSIWMLSHLDTVMRKNLFINAPDLLPCDFLMTILVFLRIINIISCPHICRKPIRSPLAAESVWATYSSLQKSIYSNLFS